MFADAALASEAEVAARHQFKMFFKDFVMLLVEAPFHFSPNLFKLGGKFFFARIRRFRKMISRISIELKNKGLLPRRPSFLASAV